MNRPRHNSIRVNVSLQSSEVRRIDDMIERSHLFSTRSEYIGEAARSSYMRNIKMMNETLSEYAEKYGDDGKIRFELDMLKMGSELSTRLLAKGPLNAQAPIRTSPEMYTRLVKMASIFGINVNRYIAIAVMVYSDSMPDRLGDMERLKTTLDSFRPRSDSLDGRSIAELMEHWYGMRGSS